MKPELIKFYMNVATDASELSKCTRSKVGAVIVKNDNIISWGYNGTLPGDDNCCEEKHWMPLDYPEHHTPEEIEENYPIVEYSDYGSPDTVIGRYKLVTKADVLHAEQNAIMKLTTGTESSEGASLFCTLSPCETCAILIVKAKIKEVYFKTIYRNTKGLEKLRKFGVKLIQVGDEIE